MNRTHVSTNAPAPRALRTRWSAIGAAVAVTLGGGAFAVAAADEAEHTGDDGGVFVAVEPCRLFDTRSGDTPDVVESDPGRWNPIGPDTSAPVTSVWDGPCGVPFGASAVSLSVTALGATEQTNLRLFPGFGPVPTAAVLNPAPGEAPTSTSVTVGLDDSGTFSIFNRFGEVQVVVDVNGYYRDHDHDDQYVRRPELAWASIGASGDLFHQVGGAIVSVERTSAGIYDIVLSDDRQMCVFQVTPTEDIGDTPAPVIAQTAMVISPMLRVLTRDLSGAPVDSPFGLTISCTPSADADAPDAEG